MSRNDHFKPKPNQPFLSLVKYLSGYKKFCWSAISLTALQELFGCIPGIILSLSIAVVIERDHAFLARYFGIHNLLVQFVVLGSCALVMWSARSILEYLSQVKCFSLAQAIQHKLRVDIYTHIQTAPMQAIQRKPVGELVSNINDDINQLARFFERDLANAITIIVTSVFLGGVFFILSPLVAAAIMVPIIIGVLLSVFYFNQRLRNNFSQARQEAANISTGLEHNFHGIMTIKSYTGEQHEARRLWALSRNYRRTNQKAISLSAQVTPVMRYIINLGTFSALCVAGYEAIHQNIGIGSFSTFLFLTQRLAYPYSYFGSVITGFQQAMASVSRALELLSWQPEAQGGSINRVSHLKQDLILKNLGFRYPDKQAFVLEDFNLVIPAGKTVAFVGESGVGKSTLVNLLCRFYEPTVGEICYGKDNIQDFSNTLWRQQVALVSQEIFLFYDTVRENIAYANPAASTQDIVAAAKLAGADRFIQALPQGYNTLIGPHGVTLSGGQQQRIAIARAILKAAPIMVLDEATSALDSETERAVQWSIASLAGQHTIIIITHRLQAVKNIDCIFVMEEGRIVESGTHEELLRRQGQYANLWQAWQNEL